MTFLKKRIPAARDIYYVYSVVNFLAFFWAIIIFFYYLPSWMLQYSLGELFSAFCYGVLVVVVDVLLILLLAVIVSFLFPPKWMKEHFVSTGSFFAASVFIWIILLKLTLNVLMALDQINLIFIIFAIVVSLFSTIYIPIKFPKVSKILVSIAKRVSILSVIYIPLSIISLIVVVIRNIF